MAIFIRRSVLFFAIVLVTRSWAGDTTQLQSIGTGNGSIHIIPALSAPSVKNGGKLTVSAVVKAQAGVREVVADFGGVESVILKASSELLGGIEGDRTLGLWSGEWTAHSLNEKVYSVCIRVTDLSGRVFEDRSLSFSDPAAGLSTPGSTAYPNGGMRKIGVATLRSAEISLVCAAIDTTNGYAYFVTRLSPCVVLKVNLGAGAAAPVHIASVTLSAGEIISTAVIDPVNGYGYFGTNTSPGVVVKVALGAGTAAPVRVGALTLNAGENNLSSVVLDSVNGHAYFGTDTLPGIVVKVAVGAGATLPTRVAALSLNLSENSLSSAVIDTANGYAYFGTNTNPGYVIKVALGAGASAPTRVGTANFLFGEMLLTSAVIDAANGYAYFGTNTSPGIVVKVALGAGTAWPSRVGIVALNPGENSLTSSGIDTATGHACFGTKTSPGRIVKVALGAGAAAPTRVDAVTFNGGENQPCGVFDSGNGYAYFGTDTQPGIIVKAALGAGAAAPARVAATSLYPGDYSLKTAVIDAANGYAYFGTQTDPGVVVKVSLGAGGTPPTRVGAATFDPGEINLSSAAIDTVNGYAYFGTLTSPGRVIKVALGNGDAPPTRVGAVTLDVGENELVSALIDETNGYAYFGTNTLPGIVVKVALGTGAAAPTRVGAVTLTSAEKFLKCAAIDATNGYAYYGSSSSGVGIIVKVALGVGADPPTRVTFGYLDLGEIQLTTAAIDTANGYAYFVSDISPPVVVKVALGTGAAAPTRIGAVTLSASESGLRSAAIDTSNGVAYFATNTAPGRIVKIGLGAGAATPEWLGTLALDANEHESELYSAVIDPANGHTFFGTFTGAPLEPSKVVKVGLNQSSRLTATKMILAEDAIVTDMRFFSHTASGNLRLALYDNAAPKNRVWESASVPNTAAGAEITVPISSGTPGLLTLAPGTYWLAWQIDTPTAVPSYTTGAAGDGFYVNQAYGAFPATLGSESSTSERWTQYITYSNPIFVITGGATQTAGTSQNITITAKDGTNNTVTTYAGLKPLIFSGASSSTDPVMSPTASGIDFGATTSITFSGGVATVALIPYKAEVANIAAIEGNVTTMTPLNVTVSKTSASKLTFSTQPGNGVGGFPLTAQPTVTLLDAFGNVASGVDQTVTLAIQNNAGPEGVLSGNNSVAVDTSNGVATFSGLSIDKGGTGYTLAATGNTIAPTPGMAISAAFDILNTIPSIVSGPAASPNPAAVGQMVTFGAVATDAEHTALTYAWSIDGNVFTGAAPKHVFVAPGMYTVNLTVSDGAGGSATGSVQMTVNAPAVGTGNDTDGDGFSDVFETATGTDPNNAADSPTGGVAPTIVELAISKLSIKLNFTKTKSDTLQLNGSLPVATGYNAANQTIAVDVGGVVKAIKLDSKGKSTAFRLGIKVKQGVVPSQMAKFSVKLSKGDFATAFEDEGLNSTDATKVPVRVVVRLVFNGAVYERTQALFYSSRSSKSGLAKER